MRCGWNKSGKVCMDEMWMEKSGKVCVDEMWMEQGWGNFCG